MGRQSNKLIRLLRLIQLIRSRSGQPVSDLARACEMTERTIYRDLQALNSAGIPCIRDSETGGYRVQPGFYMPPVELTFEEAMATVALLEQTSRSSQLPFLGTVQRVAEKLRAQLPRSLMEEIEPLDGHITIDLARSNAEESARQVYEDVRYAIAKKRMLRCTYDPSKSNRDDREDEFDFKPYQLWYCQRGWYAVGHHSRRNEVRMLKLNRFTFVHRTDRPYHIPDDFKLSELIGNAWRMIRGHTRYDIAIRFSQSVADTVTETRWHPTQKEDPPADDGSVTLHFSVDGLEEIVWWILSYGPNATVLQPSQLVEKVRGLIASSAHNYQA
jgi:proteasome accessory factor B